MKRPEKLMIVGAGLSGLSAAYYHLQGKKPTEVHIFEKEDEIGGRIKTVNFDSCRVDVGAQFLTKGDGEVFNLINRIGVSNSLRKINMNFSFHDGVKLSNLSFKDLIKNTSIKEKIEFGKLFIKIKKIRERLDSSSADNLDSNYTQKTFGEWYQETIGEEMLWLYDSMFKSICFVDSSRISALYGLVIVQALFNQCYSFDKGLSRVVDSLLSEMNNLNLHTEVCVKNLESLEFDSLFLSVPFPEAKKMIGELRCFDIEYSSCTYVTLKLNKRLWSKYWGVFTEKECSLSFLSDETLKFTNKCQSNSVLGVIIPRTISNNNVKAFKETIDEISKLFEISEDEVVGYRVYRWYYALPVCSPSFHKTLSEIKTIPLGNISLCGDFMALPSLDGAIESGRIVAEKLANRRETNF